MATKDNTDSPQFTQPNIIRTILRWLKPARRVYVCQECGAIVEAVRNV